MTQTTNFPPSLIHKTTEKIKEIVINVSTDILTFSINETDSFYYLYNFLHFWERSQNGLMSVRPQDVSENHIFTTLVWERVPTI